MKRTALHRTLVLTCSVVGAAVVALDGTVLTIAQPALRRDLGADTGQVQWTSTGYLVAVASMLVFAGRLGDRYGHRRLFAVGCLGFAATSAAISAAPGIGWVVALRVAQGVAGALLQPATLGMLRGAYPPERLGMPVALRTSAIGLAAAAGPLIGGVLVDAYGWRAVFLLGVPPTVAVALLCLTTPGARRSGTGPETRAVLRSGAPLVPGRGGMPMPGAGATVAAVAGGGPVGRCSAGAGSRATGGPEAGPVSGAAVVPAPEPVGTAGRFATGPGTGAAPAAGPAPTVTRAPRLPAGRFTTEPRATATGLERAPGSRAAGPAPAPGAAAPASVADASASGVTVLASKVTAPAPVTDASASGATVSASEVTAPASLADAPASEATTPAPGGTAPAPPAPQAEVSPAPPERLAAVSPAPPEGLAALDLPGACLLGLALACLVQGLVAGAVPALGAAGVAGVAFLWRERRAPSPLLPPGMLRPGPVAAGLGVLLAASAALSGTLFTATFLLQDTLGLDAPTTARRMVPLAVLMVIGAPLSAVLKKRFGARRVATGGAVLLAAGVLLLARPAVTDSGLATGACAALIGAGFGAVMVTATSVVVHRAAEEHAGVAGGLQQTAMNTGPIIGVALATPLLASGTALPALAAVAALAVPAALALPGPERGTDTPAGA